MVTSREISGPLTFIAAILVVATLYFGRVIFIPLVWASLFAFLLTPIVAFLERLRFPRVLAIFFVILVLMGLAALLGWNTSRQLSDLSSQLPSYKKTLEQNIRAVKGLQSHGFSQASTAVKDIQKEIINAAPGSSPPENRKNAETTAPQPVPVQVMAPTSVMDTLVEVVAPLTNAGLVAIFTLFILAGREDIRNRFIRLTGHSRLQETTQALDDAGRRVNRYLLLQLLVNAGYGLVIGIVLHFIGIPNASLWGVVAAILRFVPYVGPLLAVVMPLLLSLAVFTALYHALAVVTLFFGLEMIVGNFVEPPLYGAHVGLSPLALLVTTVFWTSIWGLPGLILATPLTVCLVVVGRYVPSWRFLSILLGDEPVLSPHEQYYQRLLATDQEEARQVLEQHRKSKSLEEVYGSVIIPALILAQQDRQRNGLADEAHEFIYQSSRELIDEFGADLPDSREESAVDQAESADRLRILCAPAKEDADAVVALLLSQLLERKGHVTTIVAIGATSEALSQAAELTPDVICISAMPPFAVEHARARYRELRARWPQAQILVCMWQFAGSIPKLVMRIGMGERDKAFSNLPDVLNYISNLGRNNAAQEPLTVLNPALHRT